MRDRELAMPICPGMVPPGWIEAQGLIAFPEQPPLTDVAQEGEAAKTSLLRQPDRGQTENYAPRASISPAGDAGSTPNEASTL
jgi:hypothetical protein